MSDVLMTQKLKELIDTIRPHKWSGSVQETDINYVLFEKIAVEKNAHSWSREPRPYKFPVQVEWFCTDFDGVLLAMFYSHYTMQAPDGTHLTFTPMMRMIAEKALGVLPGPVMVRVPQVCKNVFVNRHPDQCRFPGVVEELSYWRLMSE